MKRKKDHIRLIGQDKALNIAVAVLWAIILLIVLYPLYVVIIASISDPAAVYRGEVVFAPKGVTFIGYKTIFKYNEMWRSYANSIIYTVAGTMLSVTVTMMAGFALSRNFRGKTFFNLIFVFVMLFNGGLIPTFLVVRDIGLYNTPWIMIINGCVSVWNLMIARTYITNTIPDEILEAAQLDGASYARYFVQILLPMCGAIVAVLTVYYAVAKWNDYYSGLIYLRTTSLFPLQTLLRGILATLEVVDTEYNELMAESQANSDALKTAQLAKYCIIIVSTGPAIVLYIFMQKYFVKGVMIGSLKG